MLLIDDTVELVGTDKIGKVADVFEDETGSILYTVCFTGVDPYGGYTQSYEYLRYEALYYIDSLEST